jgi:putative AdoMet-dependent methyltransferase
MKGRGFKLLDNKGFDIWSAEYDKFVERNSKGYPFEGYYEVLNFVYKLIGHKENSKILDIGVGTGMLTNQLYKDGAVVYGLDFSQSMLQKAQEKMPQAKLIQWDFNNGLPEQLRKERFDYIISSYAIHHLNNDKKVEFFRDLKETLNNDGKIIVADVAFKTFDDLETCRINVGYSWDSDEIYMTIDEMGERLRALGIKYNYTQVSSCAGVLEIF